MSDAIPVTIVTGYLGAGKTTFVNGLLNEARGQRIAVLVNDFGEISIDADLIVSQDNDTIALANGCMCCSLGDDLFDAIDRILNMKPRPDHLVIETSGVADPRHVRQIALAEPGLAHRGTVTLVDAANFLDTLSDPILSDTLLKQLREAQLVLVNKTDLCERPAVEAVAVEVRCHAMDDVPVVLADGPVSGASILDAFEARHEGFERIGSMSLRHRQTYRSWATYPELPAEREAVERFLERADLGIYRVKGFLTLGNGDHVIVQKTGRQWSIEPDSIGRAGRGQRLVAIGAAVSMDCARLDEAWAKAGDATIRESDRSRVLTAAK